MANIYLLPARFKKFTIQLVNVGSGGYTTGNINVPVNGKVVEVQAVKQAGTGTQVTVQLKENGARILYDSGNIVNFPVSKTELARPYTLAPGQSIQVGAKVDSGNDTTVNVDVFVEV
jgi:hypothetical protein